MFDGDDQGAAAALLARLRDVVSELQTLDMHSLADNQLLGVLQELEVQKRRLQTVDHRVVGQVHQRGIAREHACTSTGAMLRQLLRIGSVEAAHRVDAATDLGPRQAVNGEVLPALFARTAAACAAGEISASHARAITTTIAKLPLEVQAEKDLETEQFLLEQARIFSPETLGRVTRKLIDTCDPDGTLTEEDHRRRIRCFEVYPRKDGSSRVHGELDALTTEALLSVLDATAKPRPATDGTPDRRTAGQRNHDGLYDTLILALQTEKLPPVNGVSTTILLTMTEEQLYHRLNGCDGQAEGLVTTGHGAQISLTEALKQASDARVIPIVFGKAKEILAYGTSHRIFNENQRLVMIARDGGCSFPGCDRPPQWTEAHHAPEWILTHRTRVDEGTMVCGFHHREHERLGWQTVMLNGIPHWKPPTWIDPDQVPLRNRMHDPQPAEDPTLHGSTEPPVLDGALLDGALLDGAVVETGASRSNGPLIPV
jgi:hypothetical protein